MKLRHAFLIAFGVALPLWIRQYAFEQGVVEEVERLTEALLEAHGDHVESREANRRSQGR